MTFYKHERFEEIMVVIDLFCYDAEGLMVVMYIF